MADFTLFKSWRGQEATIGGMGTLAHDYPSFDPPSTVHFFMSESANNQMHKSHKLICVSVIIMTTFCDKI